MAKKKMVTTPKEVKEVKSEEKTVSTVEIVEEVKKSELPIFIKKSLDSLNIEELVAYEKACSVVCGRYEVKARLSGEDNAKFRDFLKYHKMLVNEMEKRVLNICEIED